ncbi:transglycosylase domain-containing protein [Agromyces subbeticus]|uniref:transglycosylase domain-containing protein n=1 Tax=Agromyces subbeticus TaxID=293890 RepID=UPI0003B48FD3|nr:transglycosylase domain-containing protein [Agromyces subbeticus]
MSDVGAGILGFVGMSALAGVLVTAAVTPALAVTGMAANNSISMFENLPGYLEIDDLAQKSTVYATAPDGSPYPLASFYDQNREEVPWEAISQFVKDAAVAGEDPRFYEHGGIDVQGTVRGALNTVLKGNTQGGSSITQQYVKNVLIQDGISEATTPEEEEAAYEAATETTIDRKLKEMRYAISIEKKYPKDDILRSYLNIAHFGGRVYGIESAARYYFNDTSAANLTVEQAASLIAIVNNPEKFRLDYPENEKNGAATVNDKGEPVPYAANKERRDYILTEMLKLKKITQEQYDVAIATPVAPVIKEPSTGCQTAGGSAFFCDYVTWVIKDKYDDPATPDVNEGARLLQKGGLDIYTTLDLELQNEAEATMRENVPFADPRFDVGSVAVSMEVGTGKILAMAQNKNYTQDPDVIAASAGDYSSINYSTDYEHGGSLGFQPGSTFKVFTLAEWLNEGHSLRETFNGSRRNFTSFPAACYGGWNGAYDPKNDDGRGANNAVDATKYSVNTAFVAMGQQLDLCKIKDAAQAFGVRRADGLDLGQKPAYDKETGAPLFNADGTRQATPDDVFGPSAILGTEEVAPLSMVAAFAGVANNGATCSPIAIARIVDSKGADKEVPKTECPQSVTPEVAHAMAYAMEQTFSGTASASGTGTGVPHIGKTGTTDENKDTWMNGASTRVATAVWVGSVTGTANQRQLDDWDSGPVATARHRMWKQIMTVADNKYGGDEFPEPDQSAFKQVLADIPQVAGLSLDAAKQAIEAAGFVFEDGGPQDSNLPAGTVTGTDPSGQAGKGSTIRVFTSNGSMVGVPNVVGMTGDQADAALKQAGFRVQRQNENTTDPTKVNVVISQNPAGGGAAKPGDQVTISVGKLAAGGNAPADD